jgi:DNA-binding MarR family transcriptional regulator
MVVTRVQAVGISATEQLIVLEIGRDRIDTANSFVEYICEMYALSKSTVWYNLKKLKESGTLTFATKEERGRMDLALTKRGIEMLKRIEPRRAQMESRFSRTYEKGDVYIPTESDYYYPVGVSLSRA